MSKGYENLTIDDNIYKQYRDLADLAPRRRYGYHPQVSRSQQQPIPNVKSRLKPTPPIVHFGEQTLETDVDR